MVRDFLNKQHYSVSSVSSVQSALSELTHSLFDCVILDIGLIDGSGFEVLEMIKRKNIKTGIIIVSARDSIEDKLKGFELGSDDYLTKPFHLTELNARIKSLIRRQSENTSLDFGLISVQTLTHEVTIQGHKLPLTQKEYKLLIYLISNPDRFLDKSTIARHLWENNTDAFESHDFVYTHIKKLRKKLSEAGLPGYLTTRYGLGYIFSKDEAVFKDFPLFIAGYYTCWHPGWFHPISICKQGYAGRYR
ncbi:MAG: response regulator transcription factor [Leadbetterella sp.]|nr:response regulator transcription factor [Leadbetterella sp.]